MDLQIAKKLSMPKDYKTSTYFTGFHHKAYVENVQTAQNKFKNTCRSRSTSPTFPLIPYIKKPAQILSSSFKMYRSSRLKSSMEIRQTCNAENNLKNVIFSHRVCESRSPSPINCQNVETNGPRLTLADFPKEVPSNEVQNKFKSSEKPATYKEPKDDPKRLSCQKEPFRSESEAKPTKGESSEDDSGQIQMDQLQETSNPVENMLNRDETVTPSKIRHFQFKQNKIKGIPKDIPKMLLNQSQRSQFDQAFRNIIESGKRHKFDGDAQITSKNEESVKVGQKSKTLQEDVQKRNENPEVIPTLYQNHGPKLEGKKNSKKCFCFNEIPGYGKGFYENSNKEIDISEAISKQSLHECRKYKYNNDYQTDDGYPEEISELRRFDGAQQVQLLDKGHGTRSDDGLHKKIYQTSRQSYNLRRKSTSEETFQSENEIPTKFQGEPLQEKLRKYFVGENKDGKIPKKVSLNEKFSLRLNAPQDRNGTKEDSENSNSTHETRCALHHRQYSHSNQSKQNPNEISQLLYYNYGQCTFEDVEKVAATISQMSFENKTSRASPIMENTKPKAEQTLMRNLHGNLPYDHEVPNKLEREDNHKYNLNHNNCKFSPGQFEDLNVQSATWRYHQHIKSDMPKHPNDVLQVHHMISSPTHSFKDPKRPSSVPLLKRHQKRFQNLQQTEIDNSNNEFEEKSTKNRQRKRFLIESIKNMVFPGVPSRDKEELNTWDEPENHEKNLKFPKETKNAVMMMLRGPNTKVSWKTHDEKHQVSLRQAQTQTSVKTSCSQLNLLKNRMQLPCPKNLLCVKGLHSGKCILSKRGMMMKYTKHCVCKDERFWCSDCQNVWPGSAKRCDKISSEETQPEEAFLQIMEPQKPQNSEIKKC